MSKIKRSNIILLVVTSIIVLLLGFVALTNGLLNKEYAYASETSSATISGTSVRTEADSLGIRFTASIDHEQLKAENGGKNFFIINSDNEVTDFANSRYRLGMIIVPHRILEKYPSGTDYVNRIIADYGRNKSSFAIDFTTGNIEYSGTDEVFKASGALVNIKNGNLPNEYTAMVYYSLDGGLNYVYMPLGDDPIKTTMADVAEETLDLAYTPESGVELDQTAIFNLSNIIANTVSMQEVGDLSLVEVDGNQISVSLEREFIASEDFDLTKLYSQITLSGSTITTDLFGAMTFENNVASPNEKASGANISIATVYGLNYNYKLTAIEEIVTDVKDSVTLTDLENISSITYTMPNEENGSERTQVDGKVAFEKSDVKYDKTTGILSGELVVERGDWTEKYIVSLWSLIVSDANELFEMSSYQYAVGVNYDGAFTFDANVAYGSRDTELNPSWQASNKLGASATDQLSSGLWLGYIDGAGHSLTSFNYNKVQGGLISNSSGSVIKNLTISISSSQNSGVFGYYVSGATLENVTVSGSVSAFSGNGQVFHGLFGEKDVILKNVTVKCSYSTNSNVRVARGLIAGLWTTTSNTSIELYSFTGKIIVDNLVVGSKFKTHLFANNHQKAINSERVLDFGSSVVVAEDAVKGITFYDTSDLTGTAYEATATEVTVTTGVGEAIDLSSVIQEGETFQYYKGAIASGASDYQKFAHTSYSSSNSPSITISTQGVYTFAVRTTTYQYYIVKILVGEHTHSYEKQVIENKYLKDNATCSSLATYYYSCACGEKGSEFFTYGELADHVFDQQVVEEGFLKESATCYDPAIYYYSCSCGEKGTETFTNGEALGHNYGEFVSNGDDTHSITCANDPSHVFTEDCYGGVSTATSKPVCVACGGEYGEALPHVHVYDQEVIEDDYLYLEATCTSPSLYNYACVCGEKGTETFEFGDTTEHLFDTYVSDGNATCVSDGTKTASCDYGCGETNTVLDEGSILEHLFTEYVSDGNATFAKDGTKTAYCDYNCGNFNTVIDEGSNKATVEIDTKYEFDLKGGISIATLLDGYEDVSGVQTIYIDDVDYTSLFTTDTLTFSTEYYSLASEVAKTITIVTESECYNFYDVTLWSLIVSNADELFEMESMLYYDGSAGDGAITFDADVDFSTATTITTWGSSYRLGQSGGNNINDIGFVGYIDGKNHVISNFKQGSVYGGFIANGTNFTIKNLTVNHTTASGGFAVNGVFGQYVNGAYLENVTVSNKANTKTGYGVLFHNMFGANDVYLKNVTVKHTKHSNIPISMTWGIIGGYYTTQDYFEGKVYVDNLVVGTTFYSPLVARNYLSDINAESVLDFGDGITLMDGATKGVTFYKNTTLTGTAYEATSENVTVEVYVGTEFDFSTLLKEGETFQYYKGSIGTGSSNVVTAHTAVSSGTSLITFESEGTYVFAVRTTNFNYYIVKIISEIHVHDYVKEVATEDYLVSEATCDSPAIYYLSCKCGEISDATFEYGEALGHDYGDFVSNGDDTHSKVCANDPNHVVTENCSGGEATEDVKAICDDCHTEYGEKLAHVHDFNRQVISNEYVKAPATCDEGATYYYSCRCGEMGVEYFATAEGLGHDYGEFVTNGNGTHSRICANDDSHRITENCSGGEATETDRPICSVCNGAYGSAIGHTHVYDQQVIDDLYLKTKATCLNSAEYYYSCACGDEGTESFSYGDIVDHEFNKKVISQENLATSATCQDKPTYYYTCVCGLKGDQTFSFGLTVDHLFEGEWQTEILATVLEEGLEYRLCSFGCGEREESVTPIATLTHIRIDANPYNVIYVEHQEFNPEGLVVLAYGDNESVTDVTDLVTFDKSTLFYGDHQVIVSYEGKTASISVEVSMKESAKTVSELRSTVEVGSVVPVTGIFVGVSQDGPSLNNEILIKDELSDDIIAVRGLGAGYGDFPSMNYEKGDEIRVWGTLSKGGTNTPNKIYVAFDSSLNPSNYEGTVISEGNEVTYALNNVTTLSSWSEMKNYFSTNTAQTYAYIRITGTIYYYRPTGITDGNYSRIHMESTAQHYTACDTAAGMFMCFRDDILNVNMGSKWSNYFPSITTSDTNYKRSLLVDEIICLLTGCGEKDFQLTVLDETWLWGGVEEPETEYTNGDVVMELANAYLRQGGQTEYDQYTYRRQLFNAPESATAQDLLYLDCSSYVSSVFYNSLGIEAIPSNYSQSTRYYAQYARTYNGNPDYPDVVGYWDTVDYETTEEQQAVIDYIKSVIQPGDILVYRHGAPKWLGTENYESNLKGHAILYMGNDTFSDSTGTSYNNSSGNLPYKNDPLSAKDRATKWEYLYGTVRTQSASIWFTTSGAERYLFNSTDSDRMYNISLIRPANRIGAEPTEQAKARMTMRGVDFELLTSAGINSAVMKGDTITYSIIIKNTTSNIYRDLEFVDVMDDGVSFVSSNVGLTANGQTINGKFTLSVGETLNLEWTVRINENAIVGTNISNKTTINGLNMKSITNTVGGFNITQLNAIANEAREYATAGKTYTDILEFAKEVYKESIGVDLFGTLTFSELIANLFTTTDTDKAILNLEGDYANMVGVNLYGGSDLHSTSYYKKNWIVRTVYEHNLTLGDVIVCEWLGNYRLYIYVGEGELVGIDSLTKTCELKQNGNEEFVVREGNASYYDQTHLLGTLYAYQQFAILRPSQVI